MNVDILLRIAYISAMFIEMSAIARLIPVHWIPKAHNIVAQHCITINYTAGTSDLLAIVIEMCCMYTILNIICYW